MNFLLNLVASALAVMLAANIVPGIYVRNFGTALLVSVVLALLNVIIGWPLRILTLPLTILSLGFFLLIINTLLFKMATFVKGFEIVGFWPAFFGSIIVTVVSMLVKQLFKR